MNSLISQSWRVAVANTVRAVAMLSVTVVAACSDILAPMGPEMRAVAKSANFWEFGYWACSSTSWADGTSQKWCTFHENTNYGGGLPPAFPFDPNEPITGSPTCETYGACGGLSGPSSSVVPPDQAPPGISAEDWTRMNPTEKKLCLQNTELCAVSAVAAVLASVAATQLAKQSCQCDDPIISNNVWDAVRHAFWQAMLRRDTGVLNAIAWANAHEDIPNNPRDQVCMDQHNNAVGRTIGANNPWASDIDLLNIVLGANLKTAPYSC